MKQECLKHLINNLSFQAENKNENHIGSQQINIIRELGFITMHTVNSMAFKERKDTPAFLENCFVENYAMLEVIARYCGKLPVISSSQSTVRSATISLI